MKKSIVLLFLVLFCSIASSAQQHIKFMGIPVTGTVTTFGQKLTGKGFKYQTKLDDGTRIYKGKFSGEPCEVMLFSGVNSIVYMVTVIIRRDDTSSVKRIFDTFEARMDDKYVCSDVDGQGIDREITYDAPGGFIILHVTKYSYGDGYSLDISYCDLTNSIKTKEAELDDL